MTQKSQFGHHPTTLSGYIFTTKACIDNRKKKLVKQQYLFHMFPQYGHLQPISGWDRSDIVCGTPSNFNGFRVFAALLHGTPVVGVSWTLRRWSDGAIYIWQGGHHVGHWPTFQLSRVKLSQLSWVLCRMLFCRFYYDSKVTVSKNIE